MTEPMFLYIEDDLFSRQIMEHLLKVKMGFSQVAVFEDSADVVARVAALERPPNIFLLDIQMKPHDGYEVLRLLRPSYPTAKMIAVTAHVTAPEIDQLRGAGFDGMIGKPLSKQMFPILLNQVIDGAAIWYVP